MKKQYDILISTDSVCDIPRDLYSKLPVEVIPYYVVTSKGRFKDNVEIDSRGLLDSMKDTRTTAHSAAPEVDEYDEYFRVLSQSYKKVIHLSIGSRVGRGYANASEAANRYDNVVVYDTGQISSGLGIVVLKVATMVKDGKGYDDVVVAIKELTKKVSSSFIIKYFDNMVRAKRVSPRVQRICERLMLHPKLVMKKSDIKVGGVSLGKWTHVVDRYIKSCLRDPESINRDILFITQVGLDLNEIDYIRVAVDKIYRFNHIFIVNAGSAISCNCGAGTFGLLFSRNNNYPIDLDIEEFSTANVDDVNLLNEVNAIMAEESSYYGESELTESDDYQGYYEEDDVALEIYDVNESSSEEEFDKKDEKPSSGDSMIDRLSAIEGLETDVGLKYCMNNKDFYLMVIQEYVKKNKLSILDECLKSEDYDNYRINVHALKSTSLNIGAKELSQKAKASEVAIKEGDTDYAKEHHEELIKEYKEMLNSINEVLS